MHHYIPAFATRLSCAKGMSSRKSSITTFLLEIVSDSALGCMSICEAVWMLLCRSPPSLHGVPAPRLRKLVSDALTQSPLFRPAGKEFNHGIRRRYGLAPAPLPRKENSTKKRQTIADVSISTVSRVTESILTEILGSPPLSSSVIPDSLESAIMSTPPVVKSNNILCGSESQFQSRTLPLLPFPTPLPFSPTVLPCLTAEEVILLLP
ncbi:uncharacterized protein LOC122258729 [Penaeus japonicus]|uniref:uncharacterized protein LOC122258729 n=1 Tax=Penaeus japonicus TaxID=27405 RepID=UPI001C70F9F3|nr:uncharacterized protein LOC122258729 [Penaeus japonicus]